MNNKINEFDLIKKIPRPNKPEANCVILKTTKKSCRKRKKWLSVISNFSRAHFTREWCDHCFLLLPLSPFTDLNAAVWESDIFNHSIRSSTQTTFNHIFLLYRWRWIRKTALTAALLRAGTWPRYLSMISATSLTNRHSPSQ